MSEEQPETLDWTVAQTDLKATNERNGLSVHHPVRKHQAEQAAGSLSSLSHVYIYSNKEPQTLANDTTSACHHLALTCMSVNSS